MFRGHIWSSRRFSAKTQEKALLDAGVSKRVLYTDDIDGVIADLRAGDRLVVAGFRGVGRTRASVEANVARVHAKGAAVMDAETGRLSTGKYGPTLIDTAVRALGNEHRGPHKRTRAERRMPQDQMAKLYYDKLLSNAELLEAVTGGGRYSRVSITTMWRIFKGKRNAIVGRPSKDRIPATV